MQADMHSGVRAVLADKVRVERELTRGLREALRRHKLLGESIAVWKDGKVVIVPPEDVELPPLPDELPGKTG
jgi:hypothetical protein